MHLPPLLCCTSTLMAVAFAPNQVRPASLSTEAGPGFPPTGDVAAVHMSPEAGDKNPTGVPPQASGEPVRPNRRNLPSTPLIAGKLPLATPPRISPPTDVPPGRLPSPQKAREGVSLAGGDTPRSDSPLPLRLRASLQHWSFASPMAQRVIRKGLTWKWVNKPPALLRPPPSTCRGRLTHHISRLLAEGIIAEVPLQRCYPSHLFTVPKTSDPGGERVVIDLSSLNLHIHCPTFKMCTVSKLRNSVPKGAYFTSIDISDAFHHIPIHTRFQKYLAFTHEGKLFFFQAMPFGINIGPRIFSLIATEAVKYLHNIGISASVYIDDWLLWNRSPRALTLQTLTTVNFLQKLGFTLNLKKSLLEPSPTITYLGISWSGTDHTLLPSSKALEKVRTMALEFLQLPSLSLKKYQRLLGSINFVAPYIKYGPLHLRQIILTSPNYKVKKSQPPSQLFLQHLRWWTRTQNLEAPVPMSIPPPNLTVWTDASKTGWGGVSSLGSTVSGVWSHEESLLHINTLECLAVTRSLLLLNPPRGSVLLIRTDNTVVVSLINKQGSNKSKILSRFLHELLTLCAQNNWTIRSRHLPGHLNTWADSLSRSHPVRAEWSLSPQSFQLLRTLLNPEIDLFAHPGNAKLPTFGCPFPFPSATVVDALATNWNRWKRIYLFPPPDLIQACLLKLRDFWGSALVIVPELPSAPWWPEFRLVCTPIVVDLDIGQWVQGEWLRAREKTFYLFHAFSFSRVSTPGNTKHPLPLPFPMPTGDPPGTNMSTAGKISSDGWPLTPLNLSLKAQSSSTSPTWLRQED